MQIISILHAPTWLRLICARDGHKGEKGISKKKWKLHLKLFGKHSIMFSELFPTIDNNDLFFLW